MKAARLLRHFMLVALGVGAPSCFTDNPASYRGILGPERKPTEGPSLPSGGAGTGGTAGATAGGPAAGAGGASAGSAGTSEAGEAGAGEGGNGATAATGGKGGSSGASGTGVTAGTGATEENPPIDPNFSPACFMGPTEAGEEIKKGTPCTSADPPVCYRPCGPNQTGWKAETCLAGVYAEGDCTFPPEKDYGCYAIPNVIDESACGVDAAPAATDECNAPLCMTCNFGGFYQDSGSNAKEGYCTCREPDKEGVRRWTCASTTAWPCPFNQGC